MMGRESGTQPSRSRKVRNLLGDNTRGIVTGTDIMNRYWVNPFGITGTDIMDRYWVNALGIAIMMGRESGTQRSSSRQVRNMLGDDTQGINTTREQESLQLKHKTQADAKPRTKLMQTSTSHGL
jgi:hypothetical protein